MNDGKESSAPLCGFVHHLPPSDRIFSVHSLPPKHPLLFHRFLPSSSLHVNGCALLLLVSPQNDLRIFLLSSFLPKTPSQSHVARLLSENPFLSFLLIFLYHTSHLSPLSTRTNLHAHVSSPRPLPHLSHGSGLGTIT